MKKTGLWIVLLLASLVAASAQVSVEVTAGQEQFLSGEELRVAVRITNRSGQTLHLGADDNWLTFTVESRDDGVVSKVSEVPVKGEFDLESSKVAIKHVNLQPYFTMNEVGRYSVVATLRIKQWDMELTSPPKSVSIIGGVKLVEQTVGLPKAPGASNAMPELRHYILHQVNLRKGQLRLYLRVTDNYGASLRVVPIGPMVSFGRPETQVDAASNLHVLNQTGPGSFNYAVFSPNGECLKRQTYDYFDAKPHLRANEQDEMVVVGGSRRISDTDVPPPLSETSTNSVPKAPPAAE